MLDAISDIPLRVGERLALAAFLTGDAAIICSAFQSEKEQKMET